MSNKYHFKLQRLNGCYFADSWHQVCGSSGGREQRKGYAWKQVSREKKRAHFSFFFLSSGKRMWEGIKEKKRRKRELKEQKGKYTKKNNCRAKI